jgi:hypothetical protein
VDVPTVPDVDPDVADRAQLSGREGQEIAGAELRRIARQILADERLLSRRARDIELERRHDVPNESAAVEAALGRLATADVPAADLGFRDRHDGVTRGNCGEAELLEGLRRGLLRRRRARYTGNDENRGAERHDAAVPM